MSRNRANTTMKSCLVPLTFKQSLVHPPSRLFMSIDDNQYFESDAQTNFISRMGETCTNSKLYNSKAFTTAQKPKRRYFNDESTDVFRVSKCNEKVFTNFDSFQIQLDCDELQINRQHTQPVVVGLADKGISQCHSKIELARKKFDLYAQTMSRVIQKVPKSLKDIISRLNLSMQEQQAETQRQISKLQLILDQQKQTLQFQLNEHSQMFKKWQETNDIDKLFAKGLDLRAREQILNDVKDLLADTQWDHIEKHLVMQSMPQKHSLELLLHSAIHPSLHAKPESMSVQTFGDELVKTYSDQLELIQTKTAEKADQFYNKAYRKHCKNQGVQTLSIDEIIRDLRLQLENALNDVHSSNLQRTSLTMQLEELSRSLADKQAQLNNLTAEASVQKVQIAELRAQKQERDAEIEKQQKIISQTQRREAGYEREIQKVEEKLEKEKIKTKELEEIRNTFSIQIQKMQSSLDQIVTDNSSSRMVAQQSDLSSKRQSVSSRVSKQSKTQSKISSKISFIEDPAHGSIKVYKVDKARKTERSKVDVAIKRFKTTEDSDDSIALSLNQKHTKQSKRALKEEKSGALAVKPTQVKKQRVIVGPKGETLFEGNAAISDHPNPTSSHKESPRYQHDVSSKIKANQANSSSSDSSQHESAFQQLKPSKSIAKNGSQDVHTILGQYSSSVITAKDPDLTGSFAAQATQTDQWPIIAFACELLLSEADAEIKDKEFLRRIRDMVSNILAKSKQTNALLLGLVGVVKGISPKAQPFVRVSARNDKKSWHFEVSQSESPIHSEIKGLRDQLKTKHEY